MTSITFIHEKVQYKIKTSRMPCRENTKKGHRQGWLVQYIQ